MLGIYWKFPVETSQTKLRHLHRDDKDDADLNTPQQSYPELLFNTPSDLGSLRPYPRQSQLRYNEQKTVQIPGLK